MTDGLQQSEPTNRFPEGCLCFHVITNTSLEFSEISWITSCLFLLIIPPHSCKKIAWYLILNAAASKPRALIVFLILKSDKPNPSEGQNIPQVSYNYNVYEWYTPLLKRNDLTWGGQNQEWSAYSPSRLDGNIVPGCGRMNGPGRVYDSYHMHQLHGTGWLGGKWRSYMRHTTGFRSSIRGLVYLKAE